MLKQVFMFRCLLTACLALWFELSKVILQIGGKHAHYVFMSMNNFLIGRNQIDIEFWTVHVNFGQTLVAEVRKIALSEFYHKAIHGD